MNCTDNCLMFSAGYTFLYVTFVKTQEQIACATIWSNFVFFWINFSSVDSCLKLLFCFLDVKLFAYVLCCFCIYYVGQWDIWWATKQFSCPSLFLVSNFWNVESVILKKEKWEGLDFKVHLLVKLHAIVYVKFIANWENDIIN